MFKLTQTGTVTEYYMEFTKLANRAYGLSSDATLDCFVSGLQPDIRRDVMVQGPTSLVKAVALAKLFEEKYQPIPKAPFPTPHYKTQSPYHKASTQATFSPKPNLPPLLPTPPHKTVQPKH